MARHPGVNGKAGRPYGMEYTLCKEAGGGAFQRPCLSAVLGMLLLLSDLSRGKVGTGIRLLEKCLCLGDMSNRTLVQRVGSELRRIQGRESQGCRDF